MNPPPAAAEVRQGERPLVLVLAAVSGGIAADQFWPLPATLWCLLAAAALVAWRYSRRAAANRPQPARWPGTLALCAALAALGGAWQHACWRLYPADAAGRSVADVPAPVCVQAVVLESPRRIPPPPYDPLRAMPAAERSRVLLRVVAVRDGFIWRTASGEGLLVVDGPLAAIEPGDRVQVFAKLAAYRRPGNPGQFSFRDDARAERRLFHLSAEYPACLQVISRGASWNPLHALRRARASSARLLTGSLRVAPAGLAAALLLGLREELVAERTETFVRTGSVHLLSISGLHVGILAAGLFGVMRLGWVGRRKALAAVAGLTVAYALLIDAEAPAIRAAVLVVVACWGLAQRRRMNGWNALAAAGLLVLIWNPCELFRAGAQLSFLCVAALLASSSLWQLRPPADPLNRLIWDTRPWPTKAARRGWSWLRRGLLSAAIVWLIAAPLVLARFHLASPVAVLLAPLLAVPIALGLCSGYLLLLAHWLLPPAAELCAAACGACLDGVERVVQAADRWPGAYAWLPGPDDWWLALWYAGLAAFALWPARPRRWPRWGALAALWLAVGLVAGAAQRAPREELRCTFVAVGHGCSVLVEFPSGGTLLYDAGQLGSPRSGAESISAVLWSRGRTRLDALVLSHADVDHFNAVPELLERFEIGVVYVSPVMFAEPTPALVELMAALERAGVNVQETWAGDRLRTGDECTVEVLHPLRFGILGSDNANSLVLQLDYAGKRILLPGDLESPGLDDLLAEEPRRCDVLLAPHHGSARSNPPGFARWSRPRWTIVSGGYEGEAALEEVAAAYRGVGSRVVHTGRDGAVEVRLSAAGMSARAFDGRAWRPLAP